VQVKATPANGRFRDVFGVGAPSVPSEHPIDSIPSSSSMIPASTMPRKFANMIGRLSSTPTAQRDSIQATPVRTTQAPPTPVEPALLPSSPIMTRKANSQHLMVSHVPDFPSSPGLAGLFETPARSENLINVDETPIKIRLPSSARAPEERVEKDPADIYQQLGWD